MTWLRRGSNGRLPSRPLGLLAELTHRCPLGCPYCSNPIALDRANRSSILATWARVFDEAAALGVLQVHLSGGEPAARRDLVDITAAARAAGLYTNLITSGVGLTGQAARRADGRGARSCPGLDPGQRSRNRPTTSPATTAPLTRKMRACQRGRAAEAAAHRQRRHASRQYRAHRRHGRSRAAHGRGPGRDRARPVLWLGTEEPRHADAGRAPRSSARS